MGTSSLNLESYCLDPSPLVNLLQSPLVTFWLYCDKHQIEIYSDHTQKDGRREGNELVSRILSHLDILSSTFPGVGSSKVSLMRFYVNEWFHVMARILESPLACIELATYLAPRDASFIVKRMIPLLIHLTFKYRRIPTNSGAILLASSMDHSKLFEKDEYA